MNSYAELGELVRSGEKDWKQYGEVNATYWEGNVLFNYGFKAEIANRWNWFERVSRGLILDEKTGELVALCMEKFWGLGQGGRVPSGNLVEVTEKVDGSCGFLFRHQGKWRIATRGSFESEQALFATEFINRNWKGSLEYMSEDLTFMFEILYPANRIVVDYGDREDLVLIAVRDKVTLRDWRFIDFHELSQWLGFNTPKVSYFDSVDDIVAAQRTIDANQEGWVARFSDGTRFKFKGDDYVALHRIINQLTFKRVLEDCGVSLDDSDDELRRAFATVVQPRKCFEIAKRLQLRRGNSGTT